MDYKFSKQVVLYKGKNAVYKFIDAILKEYDCCKKIIKKHFNKNLVISVEDEKRFQLSNKCWICDKLFAVGDNKVRDHCHITGKYRGSAHLNGNVNLGLTKKASVIIHNLRGYDSHLIMQEIGKFDLKENVILNGLEKYMAFTVNNNLVFIDSMQFMNSNLDTLVMNLSDNDFKYSSQEFNGDLFELVRQKGMYPYENMDSFKKFVDDKLPDRCNFFSSLKDECINEKDYLHAVNILNVFKMNKMGDYHDLYLTTDVLLLADVFEKFINTCLEYYELNPCHYFSSPGLSWDAMLKMTGIELELISDSNMHYFIKKGMRGGISYIDERYSKANDKYMQFYYDKKPSKYITFLDGNNLFGWAMNQYLPYDEFKRLNKKEIGKFDVNSIEQNSSNGYILEAGILMNYLNCIMIIH